MVEVYLSEGTNRCQTYLGLKTILDASLFKNTRVSSLTSTAAVSPFLLCGPCNKALLWTYHVSQRVPPNRWLCRSHDSVSSDNEYRSSRNIAISLLRRYRNVIDRGGGDNLKEFISAGVNAYSLGCTDEGLRKELIAMKDSGVEIEALQSYGGRTIVKLKIYAHEVVVYTSGVISSIERMERFLCSYIANAYYVRGMAWLPVKTLQLERMAVVGSAEKPSVVASRMRLVFSTLEVVSPHWPMV